MTAKVLQGHIDRGFACAVNMDDELYAHVDGLVYPIEKWLGDGGEECPKEEAVFAIAGRGFRWFNIHLGLFGLGPWVERYNDPAFIARFEQFAPASVDRSPEGEAAQRLHAEHESAVTPKAADAPNPTSPESKV